MLSSNGLIYAAVQLVLLSLVLVVNPDCFKFMEMHALSQTASLCTLDNV